MTDTISVITVVLNDRAGFEATAASVLAQSCQDFEWIVVDGGSTDGTLDAIHNHRTRIARLHSGPDQGVYDGMNRGLALARGRFVVFLNAGDRFSDHASLDQAATELRAAHSTVDILFAGAILELPRNRTIYRPPYPPETRLRRGLPACHQATFIRRTLHLEVLHDLSYSVSSDYYTIARMCRSGARTICLNLPLVRYDFGPDNLSRRATLRRFRDFVAVQRRVLGKGWAEVAINTGRLIGVHWAYLIINCRFLDPLGRLLLGAARALRQRQLADGRRANLEQPAGIRLRPAGSSGCPFDPGRS